jgi:hypothetical protein
MVPQAHVGRLDAKPLGEEVYLAMAGFGGRISAKQLAFGTLNIMYGARQDSRAHPMRLSL